MVASDPRSIRSISEPTALVVPEFLPKAWSGRIRRGKLRRLDTPASAISRPRILDRIDHRGRPLTLIVAPAGFGKTIAAAEWASLAPGAAWLTADAGDASLLRFWAHLREALADVTPGFGELVGESLAVPHRVSAVDLGRLLADELLDASEPVRLVIDDLHLIPAGEVHDFLTGLLEIPPPWLRLVITSRVEPPLPLARMRIRDTINEIRGADLLFSEEEVNALVNAASRDDRDGLFSDGARELWQRTGGWAAGLRLVTIAVREDGSARVAPSNAGQLDEPFLSTLLEETLTGRSADERAILLRAALPDRFNPHVLAALTNANGVTAAIAETIHFARAADLCRPSAAYSGDWLEFHSLFRATLLHRLALEETPASLTRLHRIAAEWFAAAGMFDEAIDHWLGAGEQETAAGLVEREFQSALAREDWPAIAGWLKLIPDDLFQSHPQLLLARAWLAHLRGRYGLKREIVQSLERRLADGDLDPATVATLHAELDVLKLDSAIALQIDPANSIILARRAMARLTPDRRFPFGLAWMQLGMALHCAGQSSEAEKALKQWYELLSDQMDAGSIRGLFGLCLVTLQEGELTKVEVYARTLVDLAAQHRLRLTAGWGRAMLGDILYERDEVDESISHNAAVARDYEYCHFVSIREALFTLAMAYLASGRAADARRAMRRAREILVAANAWEHLPVLDAYDAYLDLLLGERGAALRWAVAHRPEVDSSPLYTIVHPSVIRAAILCAAGEESHLEEAAASLTEIQTRAKRTHFARALVRIDALLAIVSLRQGKHDAARLAMRRSLAIGVPKGFIRAYLDLCRPFLAEMRELAVGTALEPIVRGFPAESEQGPASTPMSGAPDAMIQGLTRREHEIPGGAFTTALLPGDRRSILHLPAHGQAPRLQYLREARRVRQDRGAAGRGSGRVAVLARSRTSCGRYGPCRHIETSRESQVSRPCHAICAKNGPERAMSSLPRTITMGNGTSHFRTTVCSRLMAGNPVARKRCRHGEISRDGRRPDDGRARKRGRWRPRKRTDGPPLGPAGRGGGSGC